MKENIEKCLEIILKHEGGFVNHPDDPGGATNMGITQRTYEAYLGRKVSLEEMKNLKVSDVIPLYEEKYWNKCRCSELPSGLDLCVFDFSVNAGPKRAIKKLQEVVKTIQDGIIGEKTIQAVYVLNFDTEKMILEYQTLREEYYRGLWHFETFGKGWLRRVRETTEYALDMVEPVQK